MNPIKLVMTAGTCLALALPALAIPEPPNLDRMERELKQHVREAEHQIDQLNQAASQLDEVGLQEQAARLRKESEARQAMLQKKLKAFEEMRAQARRHAEEVAKRKRFEAEARRQDELASEHAKKVAENWDAIRDAAAGKRSGQDEPRRPQPALRDKPAERQERQNPNQPAYDRQSRILYEILRTLQEMNEKLDALQGDHDESHDDHEHDHHEAEEAEEIDGHHHRESEEEHKAHGHDKQRG